MPWDTSLQASCPIKVMCFVSPCVICHTSSCSCRKQRVSNLSDKPENRKTCHKTTKLMSDTGKWGKDNDAKLHVLFSKPVSKGGVSTTNLDQKAIEQVRQQHFPERKYRNFAPLFRKKARQWNVDQTLSGSRKPQGKYHGCECFNYCMSNSFVLY